MKKAFTLIEMLVVIIIIGIVILVAIPSVRNLTYNSSSKKYKEMEKIIVEASKVYSSSYQGELVNTSYECFNIPYSTLIKEELIEETDITCTGNIIMRKRDKIGYDYEPYLTCKDKKEKVVANNQRPSKLLKCIGFSGDFKVAYNLYTNSEKTENYDQGSWMKYVYGKYTSTSPYGTGIEKYQYTKDLLNWVDMTGNEQSYTNYNGTIYIRAIDQDGNISSVNHHVVKADTTGPTFALSNNEHGITANNTMKVDIINLKDSGVGVDKNASIYSYDGGTTWVPVASKEYNLATTGQIQVKDKLGNVTTQPVSVIKACSSPTGANATSDTILTGYSAWVNGSLVSGTMKNNGAITKTLSAGESYTIPKGFHNGSGKVTATALSNQTSATATANQILTGQTAWVNGAKITGTMPNNGTINKTIGAGESYTIPSGYTSGGVVTAKTLKEQTPATATASDVAEGKTAWVNGELITGIAKDSSITRIEIDWYANGGGNYNTFASRSGTAVYTKNSDGTWTKSGDWGGTYSFGSATATGYSWSATGGITAIRIS